MESEREKAGSVNGEFPPLLQEMAGLVQMLVINREIKEISILRRLIYDEHRIDASS